MTGWNDLPLELRSKIMYSGYIKHPIVELLKDMEYISYNSIACDILETQPSYVEHLCDIGILKPQMDFFVYLFF